MSHDSFRGSIDINTSLTFSEACDDASQELSDMAVALFDESGSFLSPVNILDDAGKLRQLPFTYTMTDFV